MVKPGEPGWWLSCLRLPRGASLVWSSPGQVLLLGASWQLCLSPHSWLRWKSQYWQSQWGCAVWKLQRPSVANESVIISENQMLEKSHVVDWEGRLWLSTIVNCWACSVLAVTPKPLWVVVLLWSNRKPLVFTKYILPVRSILRVVGQNEQQVWSLRNLLLLLFLG